MTIMPSKTSTVHESVSFWLAHRPPALRVIIAGRADPPLALARLRGRGELGEARLPATCGSPAARQVSCCA